VVHLLLIAALVVAQSAPVRDFSGTWSFDEARSTQTLPGGRKVIAKLLGDEVTIRQSPSEMQLSIRIGEAHVDAVYALDGSASLNQSSEGSGRPDVTVMSRAAWEDGKLVIRSTSTTEALGRPVTTETRRVFWIDSDGSLILDRSGTPASEVPTSRSVYHRAR